MEMLNNILPHSRLSERIGGASLPGTAFASQNSGLSDQTHCFPLAPSHTHPLSVTFLEQHRVVGFRANHRLTRAYDVLRNQIVNQQFVGAAHVLAVTAPGAGCGTSTTAFNLAFSFARLAAGPVVLVDTNHAAVGLLGLSSTESSRSDASRGRHIIVEAEDVRVNLVRPDLVQPGASSTGSASLTDSVEGLRQGLKPNIVILDLPPLLDCDLAVQMVARADSTVLVLAANRSTRSEFEICRTFFHAGQKLQVVLNKALRHGL